MKELIEQALTNAMLHYFQEMKAKVWPEKHQMMEQAFQNHMWTLADFVMENYIQKGKLTQDFIKWLHKNLYPRGYKVDKVFPDGRRVIMIPWEYKKENNAVNSLVHEWYVNAFCEAKDVVISLQQLIDDFEKNIKTTGNKKDVIFWFCLDFSRIHPFGDGNGRIAVMLLDILLIKYGLPPINLHHYKEKDYYGIRKAWEITMMKRDLKYMYEFMEKMGGTI